MRWTRLRAVPGMDATQRSMNVLRIIVVLDSWDARPLWKAEAGATRTTPAHCSRSCIMMLVKLQDSKSLRQKA